MLYDPKWEKTVKADPLTLRALIAWLETKPPAESYDYACNGHCMLGQYFTAQGFKGVIIGGYDWYHADANSFIFLPPQFQSVAQGDCATFGVKESDRVDKWTFGAALERALAVASAS